MSELKKMEQELNSFNPSVRRDALRRIAPHAPAAETTNHNMHMHSFFSYNAQGWSPSRIAWEARKAGLYGAGLCDFDVLDGLEEFLEAGQILGLRTAVHVETRAFLREYAEKDINSPGEPGVTYIMGTGFAHMPPLGSAQAATLATFREQARSRNVALVGRINPHMGPAAIDYGRDVLPLTPAGAATERHIITAYINRARQAFHQPADLTSFWSRLLGRTPEDVTKVMADLPAFEEAVRSKLAKNGGLGYERPSPESFPLADDFLKWVTACAAIPTIAWLDGTSAGEKDARAMLECLAAKGAAALNIIPDRNWNYKDPAARARKVECLQTVVAEADRMNMPINIGTEMNKQGQPFVDDLAVEALKPHAGTFLRGARIMVGHTLLARFAGYPYAGPAARSEFKDVAARNRFFEHTGALPPLTQPQADKLHAMGPEKALAWFRERAG
jgi:hypothetical protein